jgi:hypothetical protein
VISDLPIFICGVLAAIALIVLLGDVAWRVL